MRIESGSLDHGKIDDTWKSVIVHHRNQQVEFRLSFYQQLEEGTRVFRDFNGWLHWFEQVNPKGVDRLFHLFTLIDAVSGISFSSKSNHVKIREYVREIMSLVTVESISLWLRSTNHLAHPDIEPQKDAGYNPDRTYNLEEYLDLAVLTIVLKPMVIIWGDSGMRNRRIVTGTQEISLLSFLKNTVLEESEPYARFKVFIDTITDDKVKTSAVFDGVNSLSLPRRCFAAAIVMKLSTMALTWKDDLRNDGVGIYNIIANTHRYLHSVIESINKGKNPTVEKRFTDHAKGEEDNTSVAENYTMKEDIADVSKVFFDFFSKDTILMAKKAKASISLDQLEALISFNLQRRQFVPGMIQYKLTSLVMGRVVGARSLQHTLREGAIHIISIAQQIVYELGFPNIAGLIGASVLVNQDGEEVTFNKKLRSGLTKRQCQQLDVFYPYKKKKEIRHEVYRNPAEIAIGELSNRLAMYVWDVTLPEYIQKELTLLIHDEGGYCVRDNLKSELADLLIAINETIYK